MFLSPSAEAIKKFLYTVFAIIFFEKILQNSISTYRKSNDTFTTEGLKSLIKSTIELNINITRMYDSTVRRNLSIDFAPFMSELKY